MEAISNLVPNFSDVFHYAFLFIVHYYGWALFVIGLGYMLWFEYVEEIQGQFVAQTEWVFLKILVPKENKVSTLAVENIFSQMHVLHSFLTLEERFVQGKFQLWYSLEIVSFGGKVSFVIRTPKKVQHLVESAFYSQYPAAEIHIIDDYMAGFAHDVYKDDNEYDFFGTEWKMQKDSLISMKTYKDFEHPSHEDKITDPMSNFIESMERVKPHEFLSLQILIQPAQNSEFKERAALKVKELTGEEIPHKASFISFFMAPFNWFAKFSYKETLLGGGAHGTHENEEERKPRNNWLGMTESQKLEVTLLEAKVNKACYNTKIRTFYLAPKDQYDKGRPFELIGALRQFSPGGGAGAHNTLSPDLRIWTKLDAYISIGLERPVIEWKTKYRKYWFLRGYKNRSIYVGAPKFLMSTEEIATLFHFPITFEGTIAPAQVEAVPSKTARPPVDLPVAEN